MARTGVEDNIDPAAGEVAAGAVSDPGVFADFERDADAIEIENDVADGDVFPISLKGLFYHDAFGPWLEPAWLVVETIASEVLLGYEASDLAIDEDGNGIKDGIFDPDRKTDRDDHPAGFGGDLFQTVPSALGNLVGEKVVFTTVTGDCKFGEAEDGDVCLTRLCDAF